MNRFDHHHRPAFPRRDVHDTAAPLVCIYQGGSRKSTNLGHYRRGETWQQTVESIPMGRPAVDEEVAGLITFLCSAAAAYMTGQSININGGLVM